MNPSSELLRTGTGLTDLGSARGAYLLVAELASPLALSLGGRRRVLTPGRLAYCGSAYGSGGLSARLARHLRPDKKPHWHVDRLTAAGRVVAIYVAPGGSECDLAAGLRRLPGSATPWPGFGSSDCRLCPAHLVSLPARAELSALPDLCRVL